MIKPVSVAIQRLKNKNSKPIVDHVDNIKHCSSPALKSWIKRDTSADVEPVIGTN